MRLLLLWLTPSNAFHTLLVCYAYLTQFSISFLLWLRAKKKCALRYTPLQLQNKTCHCSFRLYLNYEQTNKLSTLFAFGENGVFHVSETRSLSLFNIQSFFCFIFFSNFLQLIICTLQICIVDAWLDYVVYSNTSARLTSLFANAFMVWYGMLCLLRAIHYRFL